MKYRYVDLTGQKFGKLTVIQRSKDNNHGEAHWVCLCECGNEHVASSYNLTHGKSHQCTKCSFKQIANGQRKHNCEPKRLYEAYVNMKTRCYNKNYSLYHRYGGRGICVCDEWRDSFVAFRDWALSHGYSDDLTLDRINNDGNYEPSNCKWSTVTEQSNNRRTNRILTVNGVRDTMANWARKSGTPYWVIQERLEKNWSDTEAVLNPWVKRQSLSRTPATR